MTDNVIEEDIDNVIDEDIDNVTDIVTDIVIEEDCDDDDVYKKKLRHILSHLETYTQAELIAIEKDLKNRVSYVTSKELRRQKISEYIYTIECF